jgi:hypothetical protein
MKRILLLFLFITAASFGQIKGTVTDKSGKPIPFVNIYVKDTYLGTTSNEVGKYELNFKSNGNYILLFQYLGYKTHKETISFDGTPKKIDVSLIEEDFQLKEVMVSKNNNPANNIIKSAIKDRKDNAKKTSKFSADFYSRGIFKVKDIPKKILGQEVGDLDGNLDSTRSGIIYQSETFSKIKFKKPDQLTEEIIASKVAGNDNGFSYNTALGANYDFYENYVDFGINLISPIADNAFNYYKYKLESTFFDEKEHLINKIKVSAKRDKEPVFEGYIYIVEDSWEIYAVDLEIKGYRMQQPFVETMKLTQNFSYNSKTKLWAKNIQTLDFNAGIFGMSFNGKFTHVFSNYDFEVTIDKKTFKNEVVKFAENANKKENTFWTENRPVPLTDEELTNYVKKDSIQTIRKSQKYLDSIDAKGNKFKWHNIITGYNYKNSFKKYSFNYQGLLNLSSLSFNTVQGWNLDSGFSYTNYNTEKGKYTSISSTFNYGFSDDRLRVTGSYYHKFNSINNAYISFKGGSTVAQFNSNEPISAFINTSSTLLFKNNFMKLYNKEFATLNFGREAINGIFVSGKLSFENRKTLKNTTDYSFVKSEDLYTSNNPLAPLDFIATPFSNHHLVKASVGARFNFGQKYISRPNAKLNMSNDDYPSLTVFYEKAMAGTTKNLNYDYFGASIDYYKTIGNKGDFGLKVKAGKFVNAENISFIDYKHFNGNLTHLITSNSTLNAFNLLPYYSHSTNDAYIETHLEHNFKGYIMNKIPLLNKLQWNLIGGFHQINIPNFKPYQEVVIGFDNIGWGKFRFLRIDYVRSYQNGFQGDGVMFGFKM